MSVTLKPHENASWAKDLRTVHDLDVINALYQEVMAHEATFHGRQTTPERSSQDS